MVGAVAAGLTALTLPGPVWRRTAVLLALVQWTLLIAVPLAAFAVAAVLVQRWDLTALGRTADRRP